MRFQSNIGPFSTQEESLAEMLAHGPENNWVEVPEERFVRLLQAFALTNSGNANPTEIDLQCEFEVLDDYFDVHAVQGRYFVQAGILAALLPA